MKRTLINRLGITGPLTLLSYLAAMIFAPLAYPGYNSLAQAVSDLSASDAPSRLLWGQLAALHDVCGAVCVTLVCVYIQGKLNKALRAGIYLFSIMTWVSAVGYKMFPESESGLGGQFQDVMHMAVTAVVVMLSIASLITIMAGGYKEKKYRSLAVWATISLALMFAGAIGVNVAPREYFGIPERFSVIAATGFTAVLGVYLMRGFGEAPEAAPDNG